MIKVGEELVRFGILVDGVDTRMISNLRRQNSEFIEEQLIALTKTANKLVFDFPREVHDDIISGRFKKRMQRYKRQYNGIRPLGFENFGEVTDDMEFEQLVSLYEQICRHDERNCRMQQMFKQGSFKFY